MSIFFHWLKLVFWFTVTLLGPMAAGYYAGWWLCFDMKSATLTDWLSCCWVRRVSRQRCAARCGGGGSIRAWKLASRHTVAPGESLCRMSARMASERKLLFAVYGSPEFKSKQLGLLVFFLWGVGAALAQFMIGSLLRDGRPVVLHFGC